MMSPHLPALSSQTQLMYAPSLREWLIREGSVIREWITPEVRQTRQRMMNDWPPGRISPDSSTRTQVGRTEDIGTSTDDLGGDEGSEEREKSRKEGKRSNSRKGKTIVRGKERTDRRGKRRTDQSSGGEVEEEGSRNEKDNEEKIMHTQIKERYNALLEASGRSTVRPCNERRVREEIKQNRKQKGLEDIPRHTLGVEKRKEALRKHEMRNSSKEATDIEQGKSRGKTKKEHKTLELGRREW